MVLPTSPPVSGPREGRPLMTFDSGRPAQRSAQRLSQPRTNHACEQACSAALQRLTWLVVGLATVLVQLAVHESEGWNAVSFVLAIAWPLAVAMAGIRLVRCCQPVVKRHALRVPVPATVF